MQYLHHFHRAPPDLRARALEERYCQQFELPLKQEDGGAIGPSAVKIVRIDPLYLILDYKGTNAAGYEISIERQASPRSSERFRTTRPIQSDTLLFVRVARKTPTSPSSSPRPLALGRGRTFAAFKKS